MQVKPIDPSTVSPLHRKYTFDPKHGSGAGMSLWQQAEMKLPPRVEAAIYIYESRTERAARDTRELEVLMREVPA